MLAKDINKIKKMDEKVQFPVYVQPKLDGYRCIAIHNDSEWELYSRNGKKYENFPEILEQLKEFGDPETVYDGEIMSNDFQSMQKSAFAKKRGSTVGDVRYHIFDALQRNEFTNRACSRTFDLRLKALNQQAKKMDFAGETCFEMVATTKCDSWEEVHAAHSKFCKEGYEGTIVRLNAIYEFKRTDSLMKIKDMLSQDCVIHQVIKGKGKYANAMGKIKVLQEDGQTLCEVGTGFSDSMREDFWYNKDNIAGKTVEIKYQELTPDGVMRFPVFIRFRDDK